ncbi:PDZ and LIM domain protein 7-like isoform X3 [Procambarus clarkii]|uniref:PDZ and LIM domain protein 7-like isoform X3 n=1 Tax=Procambarus clarkii TaxID=6728 RepID=UPI00374425B2
MGCCKRQDSSASTTSGGPTRSDAAPRSPTLAPVSAPQPPTLAPVSASAPISPAPAGVVTPPKLVVAARPSVASFPSPSVSFGSAEPPLTPAAPCSAIKTSATVAAGPSAAGGTTARGAGSHATRSSAGVGPATPAGRSPEARGPSPPAVATMGVSRHTVTTTTTAVPTTPIRRWKTLCESCGKKCSGEVLRVQEKYFHINCFKCHSCKKSLAQGGFFTREKDYYCTECYQKNFGQRCATCGLYVEGEVVSALGNSYHQKCFTCARCRQPFPTGERVTYTGKECLCQRCLHIPVVDSQSPTRSPTSGGPKCAGCKEELVEGQALIALDQQWHIWCFKCAICSTVLHGEYMGKDGLPYCEKDYQAQFGVKCAYCNRFISGKVLQAGDNHHFHPTCARCTKCGDPFGDGEEMYLQGTAIWHPRCGPGPTENGTVLNGSLSNGHHINGEQKTERERDFDGMSSTASETQFSRSRTPSLNGSFRSYSPYNSLNRKFSGPYRTCSPGLILREYKSSQSPIDITRIYTYSYLAAEPSQGYLKRPLDPYDRPPPKSPHFHRPPSKFVYYTIIVK